jgi:hypothetical protein
MKKLLLPLAFVFMLPSVFSCSTLKNYILTEGDAAAALRQMLEIGAQKSIYGSFNRNAIMTTIFGNDVTKIINTLETLGLSSEIDRFVNTLATAGEKTGERSVPIFVDAIRKISFSDAIMIVKNGGTAATDYLRSTIGSNLRTSITPVMKQALDEYKLNEQWSKITKPAQTLLGNRLNLDLSNLMAGLVAQKIFEKIEEAERDIRTNAAARTTQLLQKVFSRNWQ